MVSHLRLSSVHVSLYAGSCDCQVIHGGCSQQEVHVRLQMHMYACHLMPACGVMKYTLYTAYKRGLVILTEAMVPSSSSTGSPVRLYRRRKFNTYNI